MRTMGRMALVWVCAAAWGHEDLSRFVHHAAVFSVDERNVDVKVTLTFYGNLAMAERARMDGDDDGRISSDELRAHADAVTKETGEAAAICAGGETLHTAPLFDADVDLGSDWTVGTGQVTIALAYFAQRPAGVTEFTVVERLWPAAPAICATRGLTHQANQLAGTRIKKGDG